MARLLAVNVGLPRDVPWNGRIVRTAIWKTPAAGRVRVRRLNLDGDGQGDLAGHGGEQRAVFVYQTEAYRYWEQRLGRRDFVYGQLGENFTIEGLADDVVCIGDRYRIGTALFEVTQPRVTCYRVGIRMNEPRMAALLTGSGKPGFYFRVLEEGEVGAGDEIVKVAEQPDALTVAATNALLYLPGHPPALLQRALRNPALSPGWRVSFEALRDSGQRPDGGGGNPGLTGTANAPAAAPGFLPMRVAHIERESRDVLSFVLQSADRSPLPLPLPGQFIVLRLRPQAGEPPLFRSYSLSGSPSRERYRISVKLEPHGRGGGFLQQHVGEGDAVEASAPRGTFILDGGDGPVVLLSAGIGATPVLAMLHALVAQQSTRAVWWLHAARDAETHSFAREARSLVARLTHGIGHVCYSQPAPDQQPGAGFDAVGHLDGRTFDALAIPATADVYLCGPPRFLAAMTALLVARGTAAARLHSEPFGGGESLTPGIVGATRGAPHLPTGAPGDGPLVSFARSGLAVRWRASAYQSVLELAEACDVPVRWSCRTGVCHNCESGLVSGRLRYDPEPLDPPARGNALICCSRPDGDVTLDL